MLKGEGVDEETVGGNKGNNRSGEAEGVGGRRDVRRGGPETETEDGGRFKAEGRGRGGRRSRDGILALLRSGNQASLFCFCCPQSALPWTCPSSRLSAVPHSRPSPVALPGVSASCLGSFLSPPSLSLSLDARQTRSLPVPFCW